jgi:hypothetical protein
MRGPVSLTSITIVGRPPLKKKQPAAQQLVPTNFKVSMSVLLGTTDDRGLSGHGRFMPDTSGHKACPLVELMFPLLINAAAEMQKYFAAGER